MLSMCVINVQQSDGPSSVFSRDTWIPIYLITFHSLQANKPWVAEVTKQRLRPCQKHSHSRHTCPVLQQRLGGQRWIFSHSRSFCSLDKASGSRCSFWNIFKSPTKKELSPSSPRLAFIQMEFFYSLYSFSEEIMGTLLHNHELVRLNNVFCSKWVLSWPLIAARRVFTRFL